MRKHHEELVTIGQVLPYVGMAATAVGVAVGTLVNRIRKGASRVKAVAPMPMLFAHADHGEPGIAVLISAGALAVLAGYAIFKLLTEPPAFRDDHVGRRATWPDDEHAKGDDKDV